SNHGGEWARRARRQQERQEEEGPHWVSRRAAHTQECYHKPVFMSRLERRSMAPGVRWYNAAASRRRGQVQIMRTFLGVVELILAILVMLGVLLQTPKASGLGGTIGGGGDSGGGYRTKRGLEKNLFYATIGLVVLFVVVSVVYIRVSPGA